MKKEKIVMVVDTREQKPYKFKTLETEVKCLKAGDYSIKGYEERFSVERKSLSDFVGSITTGRDRFERELVLLSDMDWAGVVIETDFRSIWGAKLFSKINRKSITNTALKWSVKYDIPFQFVSNRTGGAYTVQAWSEAFVKYNG